MEAIVAFLGRPLVFYADTRKGTKVVVKWTGGDLGDAARAFGKSKTAIHRALDRMNPKTGMTWLDGAAEESRRLGVLYPEERAPLRPWTWRDRKAEMESMGETYTPKRRRKG